MNRFAIRAGQAAMILLAASLAGCGGDDNNGGSAQPAMTGATASLGAITGATAIFYQADGETEIGRTETGDDGSAEIDSGNYNGPVVVEIRGDDDATYFDEATGNRVAFGPGESLFALAPAAGGNVAVTPLTQLGYLAATRNSLFPLNADEIDQINAAVANALAGGIDILTPPTPLAEAGMGQLTNDDAGRYALVLAALAYLGNDGNGDSDALQPALEVARALFADAADGQIDGLAAGSAVAGYIDFVNELAAALGAAATAYADGDLLAEAGDNPAYGIPDTDLADLDAVDNAPGDGGNNAVPDEDRMPTTVNPGLVASYDLIYDRINAGGPFADGESVTAVVGGDNSLQINGTTLTNPFNLLIGGSPNPAEINWIDTDAGLMYGLSSNDTGTFNEINVADVSGNDIAFLGQLTEAPDGGNGGGNGGNNGDIDVPADSVWRVNVTGNVVSNGQSVNIDQTYDVPVAQVPTNADQGEVYAGTLSETIEEGLSQSCNGPGGFQGSAQITEFSYTSNGQGEVGTTVTLDYAFNINGTCSISQNGQNFTIDFDIAADIVAVVERIE